MPGKILLLNFKIKVAPTQYRRVLRPLVKGFADTPGLRWDIWTVNKARSEAGGICLFEDDSSLEVFLEGPLSAQLMNHPALADFSVKRFDLIEGLENDI